MGPVMECGACKQAYGVEQEPAVRSDRLEDLSRHVIELGDKVCHYCGGPAESLILSMPSRLGGCECVENLRAACALCCAAKGDRSPTEFHSDMRSLIHDDPEVREYLDEGMVDAILDHAVQVLWHWDRT